MPFGVCVCAGCLAVSSEAGSQRTRRQAIILSSVPRVPPHAQGRATHPRQFGKEAEGSQILSEWVSSECRSYRARGAEGVS